MTCGHFKTDSYICGVKDSSTYRKPVTALLFGSFNPLHEGHLAIIRYIVGNYPDCRAGLVVSPESPFKKGMGSSGDSRLDAVRKSVKESGLDIDVLDVEFSLPKPLYTIGTLRYLRETHPEREYVLVVGADCLAQILQWHEGNELLREFEVWAYPRAGYDVEATAAHLNSLEGTRGVAILRGEMHNISSTEIRKSEEYDVIVIGGGITGVGVARDCALRGLKTLLLEKADMTNGATGRNHGLLHSGARYAVGDPESARECMAECTVIKRIAPHCVEPVGGLFLTLPQDDLAYQPKFVKACEDAGIPAQVMDPEEVLRMDPSVNPSVIGAVMVPDAAVDPFTLTLANSYDACNHGTRVMVNHKVTGFLVSNGKVQGVTALDTVSGERKTFYSAMVVNAAGIWGADVAALAGVKINMYPAKGSLLVFGHRVNRLILNRCRKASDADILVPGGNVSLLGTTSSRASFKEIDDIRPTPDEVDLLLREGALLSPALKSTRILRAYSGVRPLVACDDDGSGRGISRGVALLDHSSRDGLEGFITITGGKLTTYRLMAEMATDLVCLHLGIDRKCLTARRVLPELKVHVPRLGGKMICGCQGVTDKEIQYAVENMGVRDLESLRRRTRLGMGTCQGVFCAKRAAGMLPEPDIEGFLRKRWKGVYPVAWGDTLKEAQLTQWTYKKLL